MFFIISILGEDEKLLDRKLIDNLKNCVDYINDKFDEHNIECDEIKYSILSAYSAPRTKETTKKNYSKYYDILDKFIRIKKVTKEELVKYGTQYVDNFDKNTEVLY